MKKIILTKIQEPNKIGSHCEPKTPNVTEDCLFLDENGVVIGFYLTSLPEKANQLLNIANNEFLSDRVPKSVMERSSAIMRGYEKTGKRGTKGVVKQYSTIIGGIPPRPHMRRPYPSTISVHSHKSAKTFVKAMTMLAGEVEKLIQEVMPEQYERQKKALLGVPEQFKIGNLFTSSISNYNIAAQYHRDSGNLPDSVNVILTKRKNSKGGSLNVPEYGATIEQSDGSILVYPAWRNVHGVTPIETTSSNGYRNSLVFYPLRAFLDV